jgi:hypothetical protein
LTFVSISVKSTQKASVRDLLTRLFGAPEEINGAERCPTYLYRWTIGRVGWFKVYLHHFVGDDWSHDLHDHPKRFISIGLWGWYEEETPAGKRIWRAPWVRSFPAEHIHRISVPSKSCWTLVAVLKSVRPWGFWNEGRFIPWREYVGGKLADLRKACE